MVFGFSMTFYKKWTVMLISFSFDVGWNHREVEAEGE